MVGLLAFMRVFSFCLSLFDRSVEKVVRTYIINVFRISSHTICCRYSLQAPAQVLLMNTHIVRFWRINKKNIDIVRSQFFFFFFFFFFLIWVLRPFQEYFTYIDPIVHRRWAKTGEPGEKPPDHP